MLGILTFGFLIGLQHALEADHVAAVSSMAARSTSTRAVVRHGLTWGLGHMATLFGFAGAALVFGRQIGADLAAWLETGVGVMLVLLGGHVLWRLWSERVHVHSHRHADGTLHMHVHSHRDRGHPHDPRRHVHDHPKGLPWRSFLVGLTHGMAGSAALLILVLSAVDSVVLGLLYMLVFGIGSLVGMAALSMAIAAPLALSARFLTWGNRLLQAATGGVTMALGAGIALSSLPL